MQSENKCLMETGLKHWNCQDTLKELIRVKYLELEGTLKTMYHKHILYKESNAQRGDMSFVQGYIASPSDLDGKQSVYNVGDLDSIPGSGRSLGEGNGYPLQYACLENSMDRGAWWDSVHGVGKESDTTEQLSLSLHIQPISLKARIKFCQVIKSSLPIYNCLNLAIPIFLHPRHFPFLYVDFLVICLWWHRQVPSVLQDAIYSRLKYRAFSKQCGEVDRAGVQGVLIPLALETLQA